MFYSKNISVTAATTEITAVMTNLTLSSGIIHQLDFVFPKNDDKDIYVQVFVGGRQITPSNSEDAIRASNTIISTREFYEMPKGSSTITIKAWNTHATDAFVIAVNIGVLPKKILQPFSFEELLKAALALEPSK